MWETLSHTKKGEGTPFPHVPTPLHPWGSLCTSEVKVISKVLGLTKEGRRAGASDESYEHKNSKFAGTIGWTNDPATWPGVMNRNVRGYLLQIGLPTITTEFSSETKVIGQF